MTPLPPPLHRLSADSGDSVSRIARPSQDGASALRPFLHLASLAKRESATPKSQIVESVSPLLIPSELGLISRLSFTHLAEIIPLPDETQRRFYESESETSAVLHRLVGGGSSKSADRRGVVCGISLRRVIECLATSLDMCGSVVLSRCNKSKW